jgi:hypothetical protein
MSMSDRQIRKTLRQLSPSELEVLERECSRTADNKWLERISDGVETSAARRALAFVSNEIERRSAQPFTRLSVMTS